jgi:hypothetical protein
MTKVNIIMRLATSLIVRLSVPHSPWVLYKLDRKALDNGDSFRESDKDLTELH